MGLSKAFKITAKIDLSDQRAAIVEIWSGMTMCEPPAPRPTECDRRTGVDLRQRFSIQRLFNRGFNRNLN